MSQDEIKEAQKEPQPGDKPPMRKIIIETDGTNITVSRNECVGTLEFVAILQTILGRLTQR